MPRIARFIFSGEDDQEGADRQTTSLAGLAVTLLLVVVSLYLVHHLRAQAMLEDCLLAGHSDCNIVLAHAR